MGPNDPVQGQLVKQLFFLFFLKNGPVYRMYTQTGFDKVNARAGV